MRELEMRRVLRELCKDLDARTVALSAAIGLATLTLPACVEAPSQSPAADGGVSAALRGAPADGRADVPVVVGVYSAPGCSYVSPRWPR